MRKTVKRLTDGATRLLVLALGLGLATTGWAVKPKAVWWGDLSDGSSRGGFTIDINNGSATENLNTAVDGVVTIGSGSNGGVRFMKSAASGYQLSVVARINPGSSADVSSSPVLFSMKNAGDNNRLGVGFSTDGKLYGLWNGNGTYKTRQAETAPSLSDSWVYVAGRFWNMPSSDTTNTHGTYGYWAGEEKIFANACRSDAVQVTGVTIGGLFGTDTTRHLNGAKFDYVVIFDDATGDVVTDINNFSVSGMTTVGTDLGAATAATGVNLPASATLNAAATPAAVFVQQNSTLTMTGSASLTVNSGTGPLYVADDTALTIDATGITSLTAQNPSVTLVSAKIYGTDLITVKAPVIAGAKVVASVTESGITLSYSVDSVTFTSPFTGSDLTAPTTATAYGESATEISFGNNEKFNQTIGDRTAIVVDITGGTYEKLNGFLRTAENTAADARSKDVYLALTGGTANRVSGVQDCTTWSYAGTTTTTGDSIVQIQDGATVDFVYGAGGAGGYSGYQVVVNGSSGVSIKGGTVRGSVVGGWTSSHNLNPTVNYDTAVLVETVLGTATAATGYDIPAGYIIGGSAYNRNSASASTVGRNSFVTLSLAGKSGAFDRTIIGGSAQADGATSGNQAVTGNSSVTITAANDVSFANPIIGGGAKLVYGGQGSVTVGGNSSVTISGGTYTGRIVAGGYAPNGGTANVSGTATLTLNSGVFTGATLAGGNATGAKTLVVGDNLDISDATATGFTAVTLGDGATARMTVGEEGSVTLGDGATLILDVTDEAVADGHTATVVSKGAGASIKYYENGVEITDSSRLDGDNLNASAPVWSPAGADASGNFADVSRWSTGTLPADNTSVVKLVVNGNNTLTINETRTFGHLYVEGSGTLSIQGDNTHYLYASDVTIASGVTIKIVGFSGAFQPKNGTISGGTAIVIPSMGFLQLDGIVCSTKIELQSGGYLWTKGTTSLSSTANTFASGGQLVTKTGTNESPSTTTVYSDVKSFNSTVTVEDSSTLIAEHTGDMVDWGASTRINVYGKLTVNCRWSMNPSNEIYFYPGAVIDGTGDGTAIFDMLNVDSVIHVAANPDSGATGTVTCSAPIRLRANATVDVAEGMTFTMTGESKKKDDAMGYTKTGLGVFNINGTYSAGGTTTVSAGEIVQTVAMQGPVSIGDNGTYTLKNQAMTQVISGTGKLVLLKDTNADLVHTANSTFSGELTITRNNNSKHHVFGDNVEDTSAAAKFLTGSPSLEIGGTNPYLCLNRQVAGNWLAVKNLTASSADLIIDAVYGGANDNMYVVKTIKTLQTKDTTFAGKFNGASKTGRRVDLYVYGENETVHSLELTGDNTTAYGTLTAENYGKVKFSGSGNWAKGNVVVGTNGWLESSNAEAVKALTLSDGAHIVFPTASSSLTGITSLTFASGTTYISFADGVTPTAGTLIDWSDASLESAPAGDFQLVGSVAGDWILTKSATGLSIAAAAAKVTPTTGNPVAYASVDVALGAFMSAMATDEGVVLTILDGTPVSTSQDQLATAGVYYDSEAGTLTKAVAKTSAKPYNSLASAVADVESGATITLLRASSEAIALSKAITLIETAAYSGTLSGSGTLTLSALRSSALSLGEWTGTVVLPNVNGTEGGFRFDYYGKAGSTIKIENGFSGWLNTAEDARQVKANLIVNSAFTISGTNSGTWYNFAKMSGTGNFSLIQSNAPSGFHILVLEDYSGTLSNTIGSGTPTALTVSRLNLASAPVAGQKLVNTTTPNAVNLEAVYVGDAVQSVTLAKGSDGIYAALVSVTKGDNPTTYYATVSDAMTAAGSDAATITLLGNTDSNVSLAVGQSLVTGGFSVGTVSTSAANHHVENNDGVYTVALDQFAVTIPSVANTTVSVSYTSGGVAQVATAAGDIMVDYGTDVTATWTAASGYKITSGASQTLNAVASAQALASPTVEAMGATVSNVNFSYGADYATATVTATVTGDATAYTLTVGQNSYDGVVSGSTVTFSNVATGHASAYDSVSYTITAKDGETAVPVTSGGAGTAIVADVTAAGWINENATTTGMSAGGSWTNAVTYTDGKAEISDNMFEASTASTASQVVLEFNVCFSAVSDADVEGNPQAAVKLGEVDSTTTFMVLTNGNNWAAVSNAGLTPDASATYKVVLTIDYGTGSYGVTVGDNALTNATGSASFPLAASKTSVQNIAFAGSGVLTSMRGDQREGYMVVDKNGRRYPTIDAAIDAYNADSTIGPLTLLHAGTAPSGWKIEDNTLIKLPQGFYFIAY